MANLAQCQSEGIPTCSLVASLDDAGFVAMVPDEEVTGFS